MNKWLGIGILVTGAYGAYRLLNLKSISENISTRLINPRIHKINLSGVYLHTEVAINNPSRNSVTITKPVVSLLSENKLLSQSNAENKSISIRPLGVTQIDTIELHLSWTMIASMVANILPKIPAIISAYKSGNKSGILSQLNMPLSMSFSTYVDGLFFQSYPTKLI